MNEILDTHLMHPRDQITLVVGRICKRGMTTTSGGNISVIDENGDIWITPSAVDKGSLRPSDIMCIKRDGTIEGRHKPSSQFPFHKAIYEMRTDIKAIIHAHPPALVSFSIVHGIPNTNVLRPPKLQRRRANVLRPPKSRRDPYGTLAKEGQYTKQLNS